MAGTRVTVSLENFLRVTIKSRDEFDTKAKAAEELGLTLNSFGQRLARERKNYPALYADVPHYKASRVPTEAEAAQILASLMAEDKETDTE